MTNEQMTKSELLIYLGENYDFQQTVTSSNGQWFSGVACHPSTLDLPYEDRLFFSISIDLGDNSAVLAYQEKSWGLSKIVTEFGSCMIESQFDKHAIMFENILSSMYQVYRQVAKYKRDGSSPSWGL